ncbi:SusC/RagA family TonB-linked outer membrane protein [Mariniflexile litorale]|uniref:SusC/RagA family TonB-linked outer membrane protein n=1 Tax=Mariniflexile litorale TaxID=3045158 RepID=A0AAU7EEH4_9FLAO|nr:SusC/RagA family TonB-linked outer membrane protein [Mariniflexile sp. KMM 9835]MDQ8213474.1 SusC/RagA family TonB-linked outer membrane protein [Mariniflexile sp. KMM 9835]
MKNKLIAKYRQFLYCMLCLCIHSNTIQGLEVFPFQQSEISGTITDAQGVPLAGVTIIIKGTQKGSISDFNGTYAIPATKNEVLVFSFMGFKTQEMAIQGRTQWDVQLETDVTTLNTVEINAGYYTVKDKERTGNIAKLEAKTIEKQPVNNPLAAMQGHIAGVDIVQTTGLPGGGYQMAIRGKNFMNGSTEPLYIVNGVPFGAQSLASLEISVGINAGNISPLNAINPSDIESMEVLKDADATAIYGARAANGVVLITTKKGKAGSTRFQAHLSSTLGQVAHFLDLMNTEQYLEVRREGIVNDGFGAFLDNPAFDFIWPDLKTWDQTRYTDWQKELIGGIAYRNHAQLSVSGGSEHTQFLVSGSFQKETTVFPGDAHYKKASVHHTINHQSHDGRFKINLSSIYSVEHNQMPRTDLTGLAYTLVPNAPALYDAAGNLNWENNTWNNPLASLEEEYQAQIHTRMANLGLSYHVLPHLEFKTSLGYNTYGMDSYKTLPSSARNPKLGFTPENYSSISTNSATRQSWIVEPQFDWKQAWSDVLLSVLVGTTFQQEATDQLVQKGTGFPNNRLLRNLSAAKTLEVKQDSDSEYKYQALFGRINIQWKDAYILNLTGRRDGSSRFGPGKQFGNFAALGAAWLFLENGFLKHSKVFSFGKLRGSYGTTGSDNIGDYKFLDTYSVTGYDYNGTSILEPTGLFNPLFGWETNKKLEAAVELGFFKDRILLNTVWYQNRSANQLIGIPLATTTGFTELTGNFDATVENTGFEFEIRAINIHSKNFQWRSTFNMSLPKNRLVKFPGLETSTFANRYDIGKPLTIRHLYHALGVDSDTGLYQFEDYNEDGHIRSLDDKQWIEDMAPKLYGGLGNTLTYKNLTLELFFQFKKQQAFNPLVSAAAPGFNTNGSVALWNRWQHPGDTNPIMRAISGLDPSVFESIENQSASSAAVSDASFVRLRNISLAYRLPKNLSGGCDLNVYLQGQNLWTLSNYDGPDPEQPSSIIMPPLRQMTVGVQLGF